MITKIENLYFTYFPTDVIKKLALSIENQTEKYANKLVHSMNKFFEADFTLNECLYLLFIPTILLILFSMLPIQWWLPKSMRVFG